MSNKYKEITIGMFRSGIFGFGGGPSVIPLIRHEAVTRYKWLDNDEFGEVLAIANALPGPIATKMAAYLGYREKGTLGAVIGVLSHIMPTCLAMVLLLTFVNVLSYSSFVTGMIAAVLPVIAVMLGLMAYEFAEKAVKGLGIYIGAGLTIVCLLLLQVVSIHPAILIFAFLTYGAFHFKLRATFQRKQEKGVSK